MKDIFWTHSDSVKLLNLVNVVLTMDNTYKTNAYKMSLLEVFGVTSMGLTLFAAFILLTYEHENNFVGSLRDLKGCLYEN